jgi:hypothetical protein
MITSDTALAIAMAYREIETAEKLLANVPWSLAKPVIDAHIASQKAIITVLSEIARIELGGS